MHVRVKICGVSSVDGLECAVRHGADAIGFVFATSLRRISISRALQLQTHLPPFVTSVAVFRHPTSDDLRSVFDQVQPDMIQAEPSPQVIDFVKESETRFLPVLHDDGTVETQLSELRAAGVPYGGILLEAAGQGGRGVAPDWDVAASLARTVPLVLAGGLSPENVRQAILHVKPHGVDVSSGVENAPGEKDNDRIAAFIREARESRPESATSILRLQ
jgi:phosphoribosylanthranilate isomerase